MRLAVIALMYAGLFAPVHAEEQPPNQPNRQPGVMDPQGAGHRGGAVAHPSNDTSKSTVGQGRTTNPANPQNPNTDPKNEKKF